MATWIGKCVKKDRKYRIFAGVRIGPALSFAVGDVVLIKAPEKYPPYIGRVESFYEGKKKGKHPVKFVNLRWFYRAADCISMENGTGFDSFTSDIAASAWVALPDGKKSLKNEVFWTDHVDANELGTIIGKAKVSYANVDCLEKHTWAQHDPETADFVCRYRYVMANVKSKENTSEKTLTFKLVKKTDVALKIARPKLLDEETSSVASANGESDGEKLQGRKRNSGGRSGSKAKRLKVAVNGKKTKVSQPLKEKKKPQRIVGKSTPPARRTPVIEAVAILYDIKQMLKVRNGAALPYNQDDLPPCTLNSPDSLLSILREAHGRLDIIERTWSMLVAPGAPVSQAFVRWRRNSVR